MSYVDEVYERVVAQNPGEPEFHQAVKEVLDSLKLVIDANEEKYRKAGILERFVEPERIVSFKVPWVDDKGNVQVNKGYRVQLSHKALAECHNLTVRFALRIEVGTTFTAAHRKTGQGVFQSLLET